MPLSISNSRAESTPIEPEQEQYFPTPDSPAAIRAVRMATVSLIVLLALIPAIAELGARYLYPRVSHIKKRILSDERETASLARSTGNDPSVLLVGNSLLLHALDYPRIKKELAPNIHVVRYVIENTEYLDWYYGLRRLFAEGVRPSKVVLCLNLGQTLSHGVLSSSPWQLFRAGDLLAIGRDSGMDTTQTSNLMFSHFSEFYADREEIRNYLLNVADPPYANELHRLARRPPIYPPEEEMLRESRARLREIDKLCRDNGVQLVFVIPPSLSNRDELLMKAGALEGVAVDMPVAFGSFGPDFYRDHFHLNDKGAAVFTGALVQDLRTRFASQ